MAPPSSRLATPASALLLIVVAVLLSADPAAASPRGKRGKKLAVKEGNKNKSPPPTATPAPSRIKSPPSIRKPTPTRSRKESPPPKREPSPARSRKESPPPDSAPVRKSPRMNTPTEAPRLPPKDYIGYKYKNKWVYIISTERYNYEDGYRYCASKGYTLVPYNDKILNEPTKAICFDTGKGCWLGGRQVNYCAFVDIRGNGGAYAHACDDRQHVLCYGKLK